MKDKRIVKLLKEAEKMTVESVMKMLKTDKETTIGLLESGRIKSKKIDGDYIIYELDVLKYLTDELVSMAKKELYKVVEIMLGANDVRHSLKSFRDRGNRGDKII